MAQLLSLQRHGDPRAHRAAPHNQQGRPGDGREVHVMRRISIKPIRERNPIGVAVAGIAILAVIAMLTYFSADLPIIGGGTGYTAYFAEAAGLQPGNEVRIAGVTVGQVTGVTLAGNKVAVTFRVRNEWVGNRSTAAIEIKTLLGDKYLGIDPLGGAAQDPSTPIPLSRTTSPYDVTQAFGGVS